MWRTVPVLAALVAVPWAAKPPDWFFWVVIGAVALPLCILPLRPRLVVAGSAVTVYGLITAVRIDAAEVSSVGLEMHASSLASPTMFIVVQRRGRPKTVHALCVPVDMFEAAAISIDPRLFEKWQTTASPS